MVFRFEQAEMTRRSARTLRAKGRSRLSCVLAGGILAAALSGAACHSASNGPSSSRAAQIPPATDSQRPNDNVAAVGEAIGIGAGGGTVSVKAVEDNIDAGRLFAAPRGRRYFATQVRACAGATERSVMFEPDYFSVQLADHTVYDAAPVGVKKPELHGGAIPPAGCLEGWVTFAIPKTGVVSTVSYDGSRQVKWSLGPTPPKP